MTFPESIRTCFTKYVDFAGTASRSEYWWFFLFVGLGELLMALVSPVLYGVFFVATLLPTLSVATRRLHDTGRSGWWQLIVLLPLAGLIVLLVFLSQECKKNVTTLANQE
jgi:uncharacterized membrane protein YhaH (DUF805 family)